MAPRNHKNWLSTPKVEHISSECYNNYSIYEQEIEQIFAKVWVPMCHTSEMYNDGDFRSTQIAHQNVVALNVKGDRRRHAHTNPRGRLTSRAGPPSRSARPRRGGASRARGRPASA